MQKNNKIEVVEVSRQEYDEFLTDYYYSLFLLSGVTEGIAFNRKACYIHYVRNDEVVAKHSGVSITTSRLFGRQFYLYAGPALKYNEEELYNDCLEALLSFAKKKRFSKIVMFYYDQQYQWKCNVKGFKNSTHREFIRTFDPTEKEAEFNKSFKYNVRKAEKINPKFHEETSERILVKLHELLKSTWEIRNEKFDGKYWKYPYEYWNKEVVDKLFHLGMLRLFYLEVDGNIHCVRVSLEHDKRLYGLIIAADEFAYQNGLQHYLQHQLINILHEDAYKYYNVSLVSFGQNGLAKYKESLGCEPKIIHGAYTQYLVFPYNILNFVSKIRKSSFGKKYLAKPFRYVYNLITGDNNYD